MPESESITDLKLTAGLTYATAGRTDGRTDGRTLARTYTRRTQARSLARPQTHSHLLKPPPSHPNSVFTLSIRDRVYVGRHETGEYLALRLSQLGYPELSSRLSRLVAAEEEAAVRTRFFHFSSNDREKTLKKKKIMKKKKKSRRKLKAGLPEPEIGPSATFDPWSKWRWLGIIAIGAAVFLLSCFCLASVVPREQTRRFRRHFYVVLCGWKREPPPEDFHYVCI